jgi:hypothetical protein
MESQPEDLSPDVADYLLAIGFSERDRERMQQLAEESAAGTLTAETQAEFYGYLHVGNLLAVMQSKAKAALRRNPRNETRT